MAVAASAGLMAAAGPAAAQLAAPATLLKTGSHGRYVKRVQHALHLRDSGHFGRRTRRAVLAFQRKDGLLVDGIVGPQTWDALFKISPPQPAPAASATPSASPGTTAASGSGGYSIPSGIVQCESGGNYGAVNPSTGAGGAYQILPSTWQAYGGQGLPQDASPAEQNRIAAEIYASQGPSAWAC
ncbi:MAG TPA: transglycosylase family protein [Solirubrobacteraceae bacterium]|nr:transglycosylase family protein [Solirubrobacteraceae bacterium]